MSGCAVAPVVTRFAQASWSRKHGFESTARPPVTPITAKAAPRGRGASHCGQETSLPRSVLTGLGWSGTARAGAAPARASAPAATTADRAFSKGYRIGQVCGTKRSRGNAARLVEKMRNQQQFGVGEAPIPGGVSPSFPPESSSVTLTGDNSRYLSASRGTFSSGHAFLPLLSDQRGAERVRKTSAGPKATRCPARGRQSGRPGGSDAVAESPIGTQAEGVS